MYIEFRLPSGAAGQAAGWAVWHIKNAVEEWSKKHQIPYSQKTVKYTHRVCLNRPEDYTLFFLTWESRYRDFTLVDIP